jgi:hypothetical protein
MLQYTAKKFKELLNSGITMDGGAAGEILAPEFSITYRNWASYAHPEVGLKLQDATLYFKGKAVAHYDATSDEAYF